MGYGQDLQKDARLNELEYFTLANLLQDQHGVQIPTEREGFVDHLPQVFNAWKDGLIQDPPESFAAFEDRVMSALTEIGEGDGPALVVTSGGLIAMAMRQVMDLDIAAMARVALAIMNTSVQSAVSHRQPTDTGSVQCDTASGNAGSALRPNPPVTERD